MDSSVKIPKYVNKHWPDKIWVYKPVPVSTQQRYQKRKKMTDVVHYQDHKDIRLVPSDWRWQMRKQGWKIWPDQVSEQLLELDNTMRLEYQRQNTHKRTKGEPIIPKETVTEFKNKQQALVASSVTHKKGTTDA